MAAWRLLWSLIGNWPWHFACAEESCPVDGVGSPSCRAGLDATISVPAGTISERLTAGRSGVAATKAKASLITQEVEELQGFVDLCRERIKLLQDLKDLTSSGINLSLPETHVRIFAEKLPLMSDLEVDQNKASTSSSDDYFVSKALIPQEGKVNLISFLPLRSPRNSPSSATQASMPSALLVAMQSDGMTRLFTPAGDLVLSFSVGHEHMVEHMTVSQSHDEYLIVTGDAGGIIRVHKVSVRQRRVSKSKRHMNSRSSDEERTSQYLGLQVNVTSQFHKQMDLPKTGDKDSPRITAISMASHQGSKYYVAGDSTGKVNIFTKNGTLTRTIDTSTDEAAGVPVVSLQAQMSTFIFRAGDSWGFIDFDRMETRRIKCPRFDGVVRAAVIDSQQAARILVADEAGTVWVFNVRGKTECKVEHRFAPGTTRGPIELASVRGFTLGLERRTSSMPTLVAFNMSHVGKRKQELEQAPSPIVWRRTRAAPVRAWTVHKRYQQGDLIAFLSEDGQEIEIAELLMRVYTPPAADSFGNFKLPVIAVAVVLVLGYQYMKQNGNFGKKGGGGLDPDMLSSLKNRRGGKLSGLKGRGALGGLGNKGLGKRF